MSAAARKASTSFRVKPDRAWVNDWWSFSARRKSGRASILFSQERTRAGSAGR